METNILGYIYIIKSDCYGSRIKIGSTQNIFRRKFDYHTYIPDDAIYHAYFGIVDYGNFKSYTNPLLSIENTIYENPWFKSRRTNVRKEFFGDEKIKKTGKIENHEIKWIEFVRNIEYVLDKNGVKFKPVYQDEITSRPKKEKREGKEEFIKENTINNKLFFDKTGKVILRDYQEECVKLMEENSIGKFILPTGVGKTIIFLAYLHMIGGVNLVLVPFIELVNQTFEKAK